MIRKGLSVEEVMFDVRPEACKDIEDRGGGREEDLRQQTQQGMKPGVSRTVEDLKESLLAGAGEQRVEMVTWSLAGLSSFWPVGP